MFKPACMLSLFVLLLLQGCVSGVQRTPLTEQTAKTIQSTNFYNLVIQDEVRPAVQLSNVTGAMGGGLIPALIDASVNKGRSQSARDSMNHFYAATDDFDFRALHSEEMNAAIDNALPLKIKKAPAEFILLSNKEREKRISALAKGEALLYTSTIYAFVDESRLLVNESMVYIYTKPAKLTKNTKPIFYNRYVYVSDAKGAGGADSLSLWGADGGSAFRSSMEESSKVLAELISMDIKAQKNKFCGKPVKAGIVFMARVNPTNVTLLEERNNRAWVQDSSGVLHSVPVSSISAAPKAKAQKCG